jgi:hypothetical protein
MCPVYRLNAGGRELMFHVFDIVESYSGMSLAKRRYRRSLNHKPWRLGIGRWFFMPRSAPYEKSKFLASGGSMVARLKLKEIDGRAPQGVNSSSNSAPNTQYARHAIHFHCGNTLRRWAPRAGLKRPLYGNSFNDVTMSYSQLCTYGSSTME